MPAQAFASVSSIHLRDFIKDEYDDWSVPPTFTTVLKAQFPALKRLKVELCWHLTGSACHWKTYLARGDAIADLVGIKWPCKNTELKEFNLMSGCSCT